MFLFTGDAIYADYDGEKVVPASRDSLVRDWRKLAAEPHFARFRRSTKILATWDNHDYGLHDGDASFALKEISKSVFLDFFGEPKDSLRRRRPGVYDAKIYGPVGRRVQVILLDTRYFRSPPDRNPRSRSERHSAGMTGTLGQFVPSSDSTKTLLGAKQWAWLEKQLRQPAEVRLLVSGTQIIPNQKNMDEWGNFPHDRQRLFDLITDTRANGVVLVSGNVHFAEISALDIYDHPLIEVTASGLTHTNSDYARQPNRHRIAGPFAEINFGMIEIDWSDDSSPRINIQILDGRGRAVITPRFLNT